jgi:hypothetical protein
MNRILCLTVVMSALASPALAGMSEGIAAVTVGDYPRAISEFEPLANSGDAVAQYQLGKLYLEGHGPADGVARGVELMTKAAQGNHPEAQAQLGLMYAMGLGVPVDNAKAYEWLTKAVDALPDGTRRTVAAANREAVQKRMGMTATTNVAAAPKATVETPAPAKPAATETQAAATATTPPAKPEAAKTQATAAATTPTTPVETPPPAPAKSAAAGTQAAATTPPAKPEAAKAQAIAAATAPTTPTTIKPAATAKTEAKPAETGATTTSMTKPATTTAKVEAKPVEKPAATATATTTTKPAAKVETTPATASAAAKPAATTTTTVPAAKVTEAANTKPAKAPDTGTQVASAKAPEPESAAPEASDTAKQVAESGFRIQIASVPSEDLAWSEWKRLSRKFEPQLEGLKATVRSADLGEQGTRYRLQTGPFETKEAAEQRCAAMQAAGLSCLVIGSR